MTNRDSFDPEGQMVDENEAPIDDSTMPDGAPRDLGAVFRSEAFAHSQTSPDEELPDFNDIMSAPPSDDEDLASDPDPAAAPEIHVEAPSSAPAKWMAAAETTASMWAMKTRALTQRVSAAAKNAKDTVSARLEEMKAPKTEKTSDTTSDSMSGQADATPEKPAPEERPTDVPPYPAPATTLDATPEGPTTSSPDLGYPEPLDLPPPPLPDSTDLSANFPPPPPLDVPTDAEYPTSNFAPVTSPATPPKPRDDRRLIDPTKPTLVFAAVITVLGGLWAVTEVLSPVSDIDVAQSLAQAQSAIAQSDAQSDAEQSGAPTAPVAPKITSVTVLSWSDDDGDHPDTAVNMIDGNAETSWHSRYFLQNQFRDNSVVTILVKLEQPTTVSGVVLQMDPSTSGGEVVVRNVTDTSNARGGTELVSSALSPTTDIALPQPVEIGAIALTFRTMPQSVDGNNWAWVNELTVR